MKRIIRTEELPLPVGAYSQGIEIDNFIFLSGQIAIDNDGNMPKTIEEQTNEILKNIKAFLLKRQLTMKNIIKATLYIKDMNDFAKINNIYGSFFTEDFPVRSVVEVSGLPKNALIEIEVIIHNEI